MEQAVLTGFLAVSVALLNPSSNIHVNTSSQQVTQEMRDYRVQEGDSITSIAENLYGSSEYWTTIWNNNSFIENPDLIEKGMTLKVKNKRPTAPEELSSELKTRIASKTVSQSNDSPIKTPAVVTPSAQTAAIMPVVQTDPSQPLNEAQITFLGNCEAGMNPTRNSGNGYYGAFQFSYGTWKSMGTAYERADLAPLDVQIDAVQRLLKRSSIFTQFPGCARKMQAQGLI